MIALRLGLVLTAGVLVGAAARAAEPIEIAVLPVVVHSAERRDYLRAGLSDMLRARLEQVPGITARKVVGEGAATTDVEAARNTARELGADYVLFGSFTQFGAGASLDIECARVDEGGNGAPSRKVFIQAGATEEIIPRLEELAQKVARYALHGAPAVASEPTNGESDAALEALVRRVEALERALLVGGGGPVVGIDEVEVVEEVDLREPQDVESVDDFFGADDDVQVGAGSVVEGDDVEAEADGLESAARE